MTVASESDVTRPGVAKAQRRPQPAHGFVTEWCLDEEVPASDERPDPDTSGNR